MELLAKRKLNALSLHLRLYSGGGWKSFSYPYERIKVRSDKVMLLEEAYHVKNIVFKTTKDMSAWSSSLPSRLTGNGNKFQHVTACYLYLGEKRE